MLPQRIAAMIASGITAINIALSGITLPLQSFTTEQVIDPLHLYTTQAETDYQEWLDMSEIKIDRNVTVIDGVSYDNVWLSNEAAEKFRTAAGDFKTAYSIASNTNGTYASGYGYVGGIPVYDIGNRKISPEYQIPNSPGTYSLGDGFSFVITKESPTSNRAIGYYNGNYITQSLLSHDAYYDTDYLGLNFEASNNLGKLIWKGDVSTYVTIPQCTPVVDSFDFDYTSGTIPIDPIPQDYGINYRVPSTVINNVYNNYYGSDQTQWPDLSVPVEIDVGTTDGALLAVMIADLIADTIDALKNDNNITINFAPQPDTPVPPEPDVPQPAPDIDPDTPASDITYNDYYQTITNQTTYMTESIDNIDNSIQNVIQNQDQIIENQDTIIQESIPEIIENIPKIDEICNNIDTAPYHDLDTGLDRLPSFFMPFITDLRSALGIWHYVTEWLAQISTTFAFISGSIVGTSIMTPIYAAIAGFMCIKIYRRMTA